MPEDALPRSRSYGDVLASALSGEHAIKVLTCTGGYAVLGGLYGSAAASYKYAPAIPAAFHAAIKTGGPAFTFFCFREYLVIPTYSFLYATRALRRHTSLHSRNLRETASAGFLTGAVLGVYHFRSPVRAATGGFTFGLLSTLGQIAFNEMNVFRVRMITKTKAREADELDPESIVVKKAPLSQRVTEAVLSATPIRKVSNEEYVETLQGRILDAEQELQIVKGQIEGAEQELQRIRAEQAKLAEPMSTPPA